jgi:phage baseplate assembly protein gpV
MGAELGRISGPLLSANLLRDGIDLAFDTDLLYFDVVNGRIGINTDSPTRTLTVSGTTSTPDLISDTSLTVDNFAVLSNRIQHYAGEIYVQPNQTLDPTILITTVETDDLRINTQLIKNFTADDSIEISTNGTGLVNFYTDKINITGNLHATGNITWDGNIIFGNNSNDSVTFNSDITSNIIPNVTNTYDLGTELKQWNTLFANEIVADSLEFNDIVVDGINLTLLTGNTIYVSVNGNNNNLGTHFSNPVRTLKYALSVASPGDEIIIYSGDYEEEFPLTVPQGVSVKGAGIRAVSIRPTTSTNTADAFLLNGETTVSELTVKGFNAPGYAFKLAPNTIVSSRSPYVQYVTVITDGAQAGNGALVDGSVVNTTSREASMLFNAVTMIVPNAIGVSATNGARIEWLNSFTYFADKGIYLTEGTLGFASEATRFGAEMRSIGSAHVYGNYGAVADGEHTLAYLIGHNFGYIGSGTNSFNERGLVIQGNEVVELNDGNIYFDSMDHKGDYRVGDIFYVNQETGVVSFDAQSIDFGAQGNITLEGPNGSVILNKDFVQSGNIRFYDNTISSLSGPVNISSFSSVTTLNTDVNVETDLTITGNFNIDGTVITFGNQLSDIVTIADLLTQTIKPNVTSTYTLGTNTVGDPRIWNSIYLSLLDVDGVTQLDNSTISILTADTNLVLDAAGTGKIIVAETDVDISNNLTVVNGLTVSGISSIKNTLTTDIIQSGNFNQTGNSDITGNLESNNILITDPLSYLQLPGILISSADSITGKISGRSTDTDVSISTAGSGRIYIPSNNVRIDNDLSVGGTLTISGVSELTSVDLEDITLVGEYTLTGNFSTSGLLIQAVSQLLLAAY